MKKQVRELVYNKFGGLCAYTGKPLDDKWQVDHITSKCKHNNNVYLSCGSIEEIKQKLKEVDNIDNLFPAIRIINHYKRSKDLELFRMSMNKFHLRLKRLPKNTSVIATEKRKVYMYKVAELFDITIDKPFCGKFYFEVINNN